MITEFWKDIIRELRPRDEGEMEEMAQTGGFTVKQLEEFMESEGLLD